MRLPAFKKNRIALALILVLLIAGLTMARFMPNSPAPKNYRSGKPGNVLLDAAALATRGNLQGVYQVKAGDTAFGIAKRYNVSIQALLQANGVTPAGLYVDQWLAIPRRPSL